MNQGRYILAVIAISFFTASNNARAGQPRIAVMSAPKITPKAEEVILVLEEHLSETEIAVEPWDAESLPASEEEWLSQAEKAAKATPGTVALIGYECGDKVCRLLLVEPRSGAIVEVPVKVPEHEDLTVAFAIAATAREALLGPLFPELERLVRHGESPSPPPPSPDSIWLQPPAEKEKRLGAEPERPWLWLEGGYHGDHPHPSDSPIHGPWLGVSIEPIRIIGICLSVGWLGIREGETPIGTVATHRLSTSLALRIILSLGPAHIAIAPIGRFDVVFSKTDPLSGPTSTDTKLEIQAGGVTTWHLPLTNRLEAVVGAGVLASLLSRSYRIENAGSADQEAIPASVLSIFWLAGISWSPL
jgi:hypothetical protein